MKDFIEAARNFVYAEQKRTGMPLKQHIDLSCKKARDLAQRLNADVDIVIAGTLLMDCMIGTAIQRGKVSEHIQMSLEKTNELLEQANLPQSTKENIRHCIEEHHGITNFFSLESEICCNADCYRFASTQGFYYTVRFFRDMPDDEFLKLLRTKFNEKKNALTLDMCKEELKSDLITINEFITRLES